MSAFFSVSRTADQQLVLQQVEPDASRIPTEVTDFIPVIDGVDRRIRRLIRDEGARKGYQAAIDGAARSAFEGGNLNSARVALEAVKANVVETEGPEIRKKYLHATVGLFGAAGVVAGMVVLILSQQPVLDKIPALLATLVATAGYVTIGIALGIILLAFVRNLELRFETLGAFDAARLNPLMRLVFVSVLAAVFCIVLQQRILVVAIIDYELNSFLDEPMVAVVVGILCGFADMVVAGLLAGTLEKAASKS